MGTDANEGTGGPKMDVLMFPTRIPRTDIGVQSHCPFFFISLSALQHMKATHILYPNPTL